MNKFLKICADVFGVDESAIDENTTYEQFPVWDSIKMMQLVMEIEDAYNVEIPFEKYSTIKTLNDLYQLTIK